MLQVVPKCISGGGGGIEDAACRARQWPQRTMVRYAMGMGIVDRTNTQI